MIIFVKTNIKAMARIYVASSWRNQYYPAVVTRLREAGHEVYDFRNPPHGGTGFYSERAHRSATEATIRLYLCFSRLLKTGKSTCTLPLGRSRA